MRHGRKSNRRGRSRRIREAIGKASQMTVPIFQKGVSTLYHALSWLNCHNLKQNEAQSAQAQSTYKGVN